jgi:hypothetical protein
MTGPETIIGIDFDNTLVCCDELFHGAAREEGLIESSVPGNKDAIRDAIQRLPKGEKQWTCLQAIVYGTRMPGATPFEGVGVFLQRCARWRVRTMIVSHKTPFAVLGGRQVDLRGPALEWLTANKFFSDFALSPRDVFFESTRAEKIERIRSLRCTHFIDDLAEVFAENAFPRETEKLLFAPRGAVLAGPGVRVFSNWSELDRFFFHDART